MRYISQYVCWLAKRVGWAFAVQGNWSGREGLAGDGRGRWVGCFWKFRRGSRGGKEGRKKEQFLKLGARDL